ncbi:MAG TPA: DNA polymerase III subunit alpha [Saprospiraceae bacterium]|nr:DNA polymerase III subunit alpha [Saprospiraceae bacterium]
MYLNCHSYFSFNYGILSPRQLLQEAQKHGVHTLALTDINHSGASHDFVRMAPEHGVRPVLGIDFRNGVHQCYVGLAKNNEGFKELNDYLSLHLHAHTRFPVRAPQFQHAWIIYPYSQYTGWPLEAYELVGIRQSDINRFTRSTHAIPNDHQVILHPATFRDAQNLEMHILLRAIGANVLLSKLDKSSGGQEGDVLLNRQQYLGIYGRFPETLRNTARILETCEVQFQYKEQHAHKNLTNFTSSAEEDFRLIRRLCEEGMPYRYPAPTVVVLDRLEKELDLIRQKGFVSYFLINWRIVSYARQCGYFYVGRGSGANSLVAYLLRITDVDPIELDLYFERFINLYRTSPPDFDIDFSWQDREDVTRFIFEEFPHVSLLGTYSTFQNRAVIRELGKVFGLPAEDIDKIQEGHVREDALSAEVWKFAELLHGLPSHMSVHSGGILISQDHIHYCAGTFLPPKGFPTTQFDMVTAEDIGLYKFDILGQRGLAKIKDGLAIVKQNHPDAGEIDIHDIPRFKEDEKVKDLLRNGKAIGCFYVESPAMRMLLKKLKVSDYLGLVAASSVIRPGVAQSGMMREYILRFRYPERRKDAHPVLLEIMPETFGVMVYQEDVIKVAHHFAGLDLGEADVLRRGMSGKFRSREEFAKVREKFFANSVALGRDPEVVKEVWRQIESFAGYAFSKGHSASYAVESYQSLFLKAHYPIEYMVATINNGGGYYRWEIYLHEAMMHGAKVEAPCVNHSEGGAIVHGKTIWIGLAFIKDIEQETIRRISITRHQRSEFRDLYDFIKRTGITLQQLTPLIRVGAFRFTGRSKKELLWDVHFFLSNTKPKITPTELFDVAPRSFKLPPLHAELFEDAFDEMELLGFPLCGPFALLKERVTADVPAAKLAQYVGKIVTSAGYLVTIKHTQTSKGQRMYFGTFLDQEGYFLDTVHFPPVAAKYPFRGRGIYRIKGKVVEEFGFYSIEVEEMERLPYIDDPRYKDIPLREGEKRRMM